MKTKKELLIELDKELKRLKIDKIIFPYYNKESLIDLNKELKKEVIK